MQRTSSQTQKDFRPLGEQEPTPLYRDRPATSDTHLTFADVDGFQCFVHVEVVRQIATWGQRAGENEVIGRLGGRNCTDGQGAYVLIERAILNRKAQGGGAHVDADIAAQEHGRRAFERQCPAYDIEGWFHTHRSGPLFYSEPDRRNQATWTQPNSIGIVVNASLEGELKVFRGPDSSELELTRAPKAFRLLRERLSESPFAVRAESKPRDPGRRVPVVQDDTRGARGRDRRPDRVFVGVATAIGLAAAAFLLAVMTHVFVWLGRFDTVSDGQAINEAITPASVAPSDDAQRTKRLAATEKPDVDTASAPSPHSPPLSPRSFGELPVLAQGSSGIVQAIFVRDSSPASKPSRCPTNAPHLLGKEASRGARGAATPHPGDGVGG